jgi:hypothetical protein
MGRALRMINGSVFTDVLDVCHYSPTLLGTQQTAICDSKENSLRI